MKSLRELDDDAGIKKPMIPIYGRVKSPDPVLWMRASEVRSQ
jgi:hypothetical protein